MSSREHRELVELDVVRKLPRTRGGIVILNVSVDVGVNLWEVLTLALGLSAASIHRS